MTLFLPYYRMFRLITKGVPIGSDVPMENVTVHPSCSPMDLPSIQRQTDAEGLDYFEVETTDGQSVDAAALRRGRTEGG